MKNRFQFLSYCGFAITTAQGSKILVDPYLDGNPHAPFGSGEVKGADLILATHGAYDHVGDTAAIARRCGSWVVCPDDVKALLLEQGLPEDQIFALPWGMTLELGALRVKPLENHHRTHVTLADGRDVSSQPLSFLLWLEDGTRVYIAGDTALFGDMKLQGELYRPHIGLLNAVTDALEDEPVPGRPRVINGEMSPYEAALATVWLGLDAVIPCHHRTTANPQIREFARIMEGISHPEGKQVTVAILESGDACEYTAPK